MNDGDVGELAYVATPDHSRGPPVLIIHSWWGLTESFTSFADQLAEHGFLAGCVDLYGGATADSEAEARRLRSRRREPVYRRLRRCVDGLAASDGAVGQPPAIVGFSMGGHWAVWLAQHPGPPVSAVVLYYAARGGEFSEMTVPVLAHFAGDDRFVSASVRQTMERGIARRGLVYRCHDYPGAPHWFAESAHGAFDPDAAQLAFERTVEFLGSAALTSNTDNR